MTVRELAERGGISPHVVRYYTRRGLLHPQRNARNGYREYREHDLRRLNFIRRAKGIGLTLNDVHSILRDVDSGVVPCSQVRRLVHARLEQIDEKIAELQSVQARMREALEAWKDIPDDEPGDPRNLCNLIDAVPL